MKKLLFISALFLSISANAAKLESDIITTPIDNCLVTIGNVVVDASIPATVVAGGKICSYDLASIPSGPYVTTMKAQVADALWGTLNSNESLPFSITKPATPAGITGLHLVP